MLYLFFNFKYFQILNLSIYFEKVELMISIHLFNVIVFHFNPLSQILTTLDVLFINFFNFIIFLNLMK